MYNASELPRVNLHEPDSTGQLVASLNTHGAAVFRGMTGRADLLRLARSVMAIRAHRDSDPDGVTTIAERPLIAGDTSLAAFTDRHLIPHTDGSAVHRPPRLLLLACVRPARIGGYS